MTNSERKYKGKQCGHCISYDVRGYCNKYHVFIDGWTETPSYAELCPDYIANEKQERPIYLNTDTIQAVISNQKRVIRKIMNPQPVITEHMTKYKDYQSFNAEPQQRFDPFLLSYLLINRKTPYTIGDLLYVKEKWAETADGKYVYYAEDINASKTWNTSVQMPKDAARLWLKVMNVAVKRLHDVTDQDVQKEGVVSLEEYKMMWDAALKPKDRSIYGWDKNPWTWEITFQTMSLS